MQTLETVRRGLATGAQLALIAVISLGLSTTTHESTASTWSSSKAKAFVAAPSKDDEENAKAASRLDKAMGALASREAALYRMVFAAQARGDWAQADDVYAKISDKRLLGSALADRIEKRGANSEEYAQWLKAYASQPEAADIYQRAQKAGIKDLPSQRAPETWGSGADIDSAADFTPELMVKSTAPHSGTNALARSIQKALRKGDPWAARNLLLAAQNNGQLAGTFAYDAQAVIAAAFFRVGERDQATALASAAAGAKQPLGLWIRGLIAWEKDDLPTARLAFSNLSEHPALTPSSRAAAHFWTYRADKRLGDTAQAKRHLEVAASVPRSFYGLLAAQLSGREPVASLAKADTLPLWNDKHRATLVAAPAGWRALALIQVGQNVRAESELRYLNPEGESEKQQAMLALAKYVPMPALALQLASLTQERTFGSALYPLPPWRPQEGFQVDPALLYALARHESLFDPMAVSARGARGLMQIMPATASGLAEGADTGAGLKGKLFDPVYNLALGQKYVQQLAALPQIGDNLLLLLAAYNGGPAKAINWMSRKEAADPLLFLETIPLVETRNYVMRVLPHYWAYRAKLGRPVASLRQLAEGKWPMVSLAEDTALRVAQAK